MADLFNRMFDAARAADTAAVTQEVKYARITRRGNHPAERFMFAPCDPWAVGECVPFPTIEAAEAHAEAKGYVVLEVLA